MNSRKLSLSSQDIGIIDLIKTQLCNGQGGLCITH